MSSGNQQHFTAADMDMLNRILERAGTGNLPDFRGREVRMKAARFLIEAFQRGITNESALYFALLNKPDDLADGSTGHLNFKPAIAGHRHPADRQCRSEAAISAVSEPTGEILCRHRP